MNQDWIKNIQKRTKEIPVSSGRSDRIGKARGETSQIASFDDLIFAPAQLATRPVDYYSSKGEVSPNADREEISAKTIIGKGSKKPIEIETPIIFGAMSFGALSREAKTALAKASTLAGTIENSGEGGVLTEERKFSKYLIIQYSTGRFGITEEILKKADAVEIKIGQGAKGGSGGFLPAKKVTEEISKTRNVPTGRDIHSPAYHQDIKDEDDLKRKIFWLREVTNGVPIIIKLAAGDIEEDIKFAIKADPDIIAIDGLEGGTGATPEVLSNEVGIPTLAALVRARKILDETRAKQELWIGGGLNGAGDFAKALALGADAVFVGTSLLIAMGCTYCRQCYLGKCPRGIATQEEELRKKLDAEEAAKNIANFVKNSTEEIKMISGACGKTNIHDLSKKDLRALTLEAAKITGVKFVGD